MSLSRLRKDDKVLVIAGKDKGKLGVIKKILKEKSRVLVSGVNLAHNFNKGTGKGMEKVELSIHSSNVSLVEPGTTERVKVKSAIVNGAKVLVSKKTGKVIR